jgi:16S rRNA (uracil1498-N3)-methyltransferase
MVAEPIDFKAWAATPGVTGRMRVLLHPQGPSSLLAAFNPAVAMALAIGPEGGFSDDEIAYAARHGVQPVGFGPRVLRTETAGLAALAALNALQGDLR